MKLADLVLHESTLRQVNRLIVQQPHACIIAGPADSGTYSLGLTLAETLIGSLSEQRNLLIIEPDNGTISIDAIRNIKQFLSLKYPRLHDNQLQRAVIIRNALHMRAEAQNALLKTLEEPPDDTIIILTTSSVDALLSTIRSRSVEIRIKPLAIDEYKKHFPDIGAVELQKLYYLSQGYYSLFVALQKNTGHPLYGAIDKAKEILEINVFERMCMISVLKEDKELLAHILYGLKQIIRYTVHNTPSNRNVHRYSSVVAAEQQLSRNIHPKLILADLFTNL